MSLPYPLTRRILNFNFDPSWFVHPARWGGTHPATEGGADPAGSKRLAALATYGLEDRWHFDFSAPSSRFMLVSCAEWDDLVCQLGLLALPEFRTLAVRREDRDWLRAMPAFSSDLAYSVGGVFRRGGEFVPACGATRDVRLSLRLHGAAVWLGLADVLGESVRLRARLMLDPNWAVPDVSLNAGEGALLHRAFVSSVLSFDARYEEAWSWLR